VIDCLYKYNVYPDFYFLDCFFSHVFAICFTEKKSIIPILTNYIFEFHCSDNELIQEIYEVNPIYEVLSSVGFTLIFAESSDDFIRCLDHELEQNVPCIVFIDCFYESQRKEFFRKEHFDHNILVIGKNEEEYIIIEHNNVLSLNYSYHRMSKLELLNCCKGYQKNYFYKNSPVFIGFKTIKEKEVIKEEKLIYKYLKDNQSYISNNLLLFIEVIHKIICDCNNEGIISFTTEHISKILNYLQYLKLFIDKTEYREKLFISEFIDAFLLCRLIILQKETIGILSSNRVTILSKKLYKLKSILGEKYGCKK